MNDLLDKLTNNSLVFIVAFLTFICLENLVNMADNEAEGSNARTFLKIIVALVYTLFIILGFILVGYFIYKYTN